MTSRAWLDWVWRLLLLWAFILLVVFFQFWNIFMAQTPVCCMALSAEACLQTLQKSSLMSSTYISQLNSLSQFFENFFFVVKGWIYSLQVFLEGGSGISESESEQLDPCSVWVLELATEEDVLAPKKEWISMSSCRYLIDLRNLANYKKKPFDIANWTDWCCMPVRCRLYTVKMLITPSCTAPF